MLVEMGLRAACSLNPLSRERAEMILEAGNELEEKTEPFSNLQEVTCVGKLLL